MSLRNGRDGAEAREWASHSSLDRETRIAAKNDEVIRNHAAFIWSVADLLLGD